MSIQTYIFKSANQQQLRHLCKEFESKDDEVYGYYLSRWGPDLVITYRDPYDTDDQWVIGKKNKQEYIGTITYTEMPVGYIVKFTFDEDESILLFIRAIIEKAIDYGLDPIVQLEKRKINEPWEKYIVNLWDDLAIRLYNQGVTVPMISMEIGKAGLGKASPGRIRNRISEVRKLLEKEGKAESIIYHRHQKKKQRN